MSSTKKPASILNRKKTTTSTTTPHPDPVIRRINQAAAKAGFKPLGDASKKFFDSAKRKHNEVDPSSSSSSSSEQENTSSESVGSQHSAHSNAERIVRNHVRKFKYYSVVLILKC